MANGSSNFWLIRDLEHHYRFLRVLQRWVARDPEALAMSYQEHVGILQAIEARDKARALALLGDHIAASAKSVERALLRAETPSRAACLTRESRECPGPRSGSRHGACGAERRSKKKSKIALACFAKLYTLLRNDALY